MDWHKLTAWKDVFSYRQKVFLLVAGGVIVGLTFLFLYLLRMPPISPATTPPPVSTVIS